MSVYVTRCQYISAFYILITLFLSLSSSLSIINFAVHFDDTAISCRIYIDLRKFDSSLPAILRDLHSRLFWTHTTFHMYFLVSYLLYQEL
jgi:hypothetical protein